MNRDDILHMALEAGFTWEPINNIVGPLERFAALVAAAERRKHLADIEQWRDAALTAEKWRGMALGKDPKGAGRTVSEIQREAAAAEREACCMTIYGLCASDNNAFQMVEAIRARGEQ